MFHGITMSFFMWTYIRVSSHDFCLCLGRSRTASRSSWSIPPRCNVCYIISAKLMVSLHHAYEWIVHHATNRKWQWGGVEWGELLVVWDKVWWEDVVWAKAKVVCIGWLTVHCAIVIHDCQSASFLWCRSFSSLPIAFWSYMYIILKCNWFYRMI